MKNVVVVGSYNQDHVWRVDQFPRAGETRRGHAFATGPGGKGFNQAVACARQGTATTFIGALGADAIGAHAQRLALAEGIDGCWAPPPPLPTGTACILVDSTAQNSIVVTLGANEHLDPQFVRRKLERAEAGVLLCQLETNLDAVAAAFAACAPTTIRILNPAPVHPALDSELLANVDILTPNESELAQLLRQIHKTEIAPESVATCSDDELHALCRRLGLPTVILTLGSRGCFVSHADANLRGDASRFYRVPAETVVAVDTTGAGDAFNGGLAAILSTDPMPFRKAVLSANRIAALSTESHGAAASMPTAAEVRARFGA
ncbi:MAG: ribokinase [Tahibacter sp.]